MLKKLSGSSKLNITDDKILEPFLLDRDKDFDYQSYVSDRSPAQIRDDFNNKRSVVTGAGWTDLFNWLFDSYKDGRGRPVENRLTNGAMLLFPKDTYHFYGKVTAKRAGGRGNKNKNSKCIVKLSPVADSGKPTFKFYNIGNGNNDHCMEFNRQVSLYKIKFDGGSRNIVYINVKNWDDGTEGGTYDADTDSQIKGCVFENFKGKRAITYRGRNTKVVECTFNETRGKSNTIAVWHFFKSIKESRSTGKANREGENRKNLFARNKFTLDQNSYAMVLGKSPFDNNATDTDYSNYDATQIVDNVVNSGRLLLIKGGDRTKPNGQVVNQGVSGLSILNNTVKETASNAGTRSSIRIERCNLSVNITGKFNGSGKANRGIDIASNTTVNSLFIDAGFEGYTKEAISLPDSADDKNTVICGYIRSSKNNNYNGQNGVKSTNVSNKNNQMVASIGNRYIDDELRQVDSPELASDGLDTENVVVLSKLWNEELEKALELDGIASVEDYEAMSQGDRNNQTNTNKLYEIRDYGDGKQNKFKIYDSIFKKLNDYPDNTVISLTKKCYITESITLRRKLTFTCLGDRVNIIMFSRRIQNGNPNKFGLIVTNKIKFYKVGFSSTGSDGSKWDDTGSILEGEPGCNLVHFKGEGGKSIVQNCGIAGHRSKVAFTWMVDGRNKINVNQCIFKDCKKGRHIHAYARNSSQNSGQKNIITDCKFHSGGQSIPLLIGDYSSDRPTETEDKRSYGKFYISNCMGDVGSQIMGVNIKPNQTIEMIRIVGVTITGGVKNGSGLTQGMVDIVSGKMKEFTMIDCNIATMGDAEVANGMDFILMRKGAKIDKSSGTKGFNIVASCFTLTDAKSSKTYTYAVHKDFNNETNERKKMSIVSIFNGDQNKFVGEGALFQFDDNGTHSSLNTSNYAKLLATGERVG